MNRRVRNRTHGGVGGRRPGRGTVTRRALPDFVCTRFPSYGMSHYLRLTRLYLRGLLALVPLFAIGGATPGVVGAIQLPDSALVALRDGRSWHATRLIRRWMAGAEGVSPGDTLTLARAEAGWGDWA
ncbi:MAG: hypothetical protein KAJ42_07890, partial [Gemmatimonadetes bacterium]|nr:hypothetical protein [Gemmatimonadota bacterium]